MLDAFEEEVCTAFSLFKVETPEKAETVKAGRDPFAKT
jgi:hypothetical protein